MSCKPPVSLVNREPFAKGAHRHCYVHPHNPDLCIKVPADADDKRCHAAQAADLADFRALRKRWPEAVLDRIPAIQGVVETDLGIGIVSRLCRDADGRISRKLWTRVSEKGMSPGLSAAIDDLKRWLKAQRLLTRDTAPYNTLAMRIGEDEWKLVIVEGWVHRRYQWLACCHRALAEYMIDRQLAKFDRRMPPVGRVGWNPETLSKETHEKVLPVFVINLDRRRDRWEAISTNLDRIGIEAERIPAVDARDLADDVRRSRAFGRINPGSAANMMGHGMAMRRLLESDAPAALILEDDAELGSDTAMLLRSVDWWPDGAKILRLEDAPRRPRFLGFPAGKTPDGRELRRVARWLPGSCAYLVNRDGARILLQASVNPQLTIDRTLFDLRYSETAHQLRPYQVVPPMARQRGAGSDIQSWRRQWRLSHRPRSPKQLTAALLRKLGILALAATGRVRRVEVKFRDTMQ